MLKTLSHASPTAVRHKWLRPLLLGIPLLALLLLFTHLGRTAPATTPSVVRVHYDDIADLDQLGGYDVWEVNNLAQQYVLVATDAAGMDTLTAQGWRVVADADVTARLHTASATFFDGYRTVDDLHADMAALAANYPQLATLVDYGDSACKVQGGCTTPGGQSHPGFDLLALRLSNTAVPGTSTVVNDAVSDTVTGGSKPVFFLLANIHAREITTPELAMRLADTLLAGYGQNADATWLLDWHEIWIVPTANPDGHWLVELGETLGDTPLYHRKNGNRSSGCTVWPSLSFSHYGIDLNRNHSFAWGGASTSLDPCSAVFRGPSALSEPETAQLQTLVAALIPDQRGPDFSDAAPPDTMGLFITLHSYSELVLWPWGHVDIDAPNKQGLRAIGDKLATFNGYTSCQAPSCLYAASGTSDDWAYGELGIPAFTFEVGTQFMPPYSEIDAVQWPDNGPALRYAAKIARTPYALVNGPDVLTTTLSAGPNGVTVTAVLDDSGNGGNALAAAAYSLDTPYWVSGTVTHTLQAADGAFDAVAETAVAVIPYSALTHASHTLFLRGQDELGNWGPVTAVFINGAVLYSEKYYLPLVRAAD